MNKEFEKQTKEIFAENLSNWLRAKGKDALWLADICSVSKASAYYWLQGIKIPRMDKIKIIADALNIKVSDLLEKKSNIPSLSPQQLKIALFGTDNISNEKLEEVLRYAEFIKNK